jgi:hypothetical protein
MELDRRRKHALSGLRIVIAALLACLAALAFTRASTGFRRSA